jgi:ABC-type sulfate transport system permease component
MGNVPVVRKVFTWMMRMLVCRYVICPLMLILKPINASHVHKIVKTVMDHSHPNAWSVTLGISLTIASVSWIVLSTGMRMMMGIVIGAMKHV